VCEVWKNSLSHRGIKMPGQGEICELEAKHYRFMVIVQIPVSEHTLLPDFGLTGARVSDSRTSRFKFHKGFKGIRHYLVGSNDMSCKPHTYWLLFRHRASCNEMVNISVVGAHARVFWHYSLLILKSWLRFSVFISSRLLHEVVCTCVCRGSCVPHIWNCLCCWVWFL
jgi:hypothetical protein